MVCCTLELQQRVRQRHEAILSPLVRERISALNFASAVLSWWRAVGPVRLATAPRCSRISAGRTVTTIFDAKPPALWPPMPSETMNNPCSRSTRKASSFSARTRPRSVRPKQSSVRGCCPRLPLCERDRIIAPGQACWKSSEATPMVVGKPRRRVPTKVRAKAVGRWKQTASAF